MKELDIQNRNLIYMLNIGDIFETKDYRGNTIKGEIVTIDNYYKRSIYDLRVTFQENPRTLVVG